MIDNRIIKLRTKEYRISVDTLQHKDGSVSRLVFCNGELVGAPFFPEHKLPNAIQTALRDLEDSRPDMYGSRP